MTMDEINMICGFTGATCVAHYQNSVRDRIEKAWRTLTGEDRSTWISILPTTLKGIPVILLTASSGSNLELAAAILVEDGWEYVKDHKRGGKLFRAGKAFLGSIY